MGFDIRPGGPAALLLDDPPRAFAHRGGSLPPVVYGADYLQRSSDGSRATAYFLDAEERGVCRAKATADGLTAYSPHSQYC